MKRHFCATKPGHPTVPQPANRLRSESLCSAISQFHDMSRRFFNHGCTRIDTDSKGPPISRALLSVFIRVHPWLIDFWLRLRRVKSLQCYLQTSSHLAKIFLVASCKLQIASRLAQLEPACNFQPATRNVLFQTSSLVAASAALCLCTTIRPSRRRARRFSERRDRGP